MLSVGVNEAFGTALNRNDSSVVFLVHDFNNNWGMWFYYLCSNQKARIPLLILSHYFSATSQADSMCQVFSTELSADEIVI